jgi:CelD/BcsL family acetyltransferase involved in cellulose biosynthesis
MKPMSTGIPARTAGTAVRDLTVEVHRDMCGLEPLWREFERRATSTVFQTYRWLSGAKPAAEYDFPTIDDGVEGMVFIESAVKSSKAGAKWVKMPKV